MPRRKRSEFFQSGTPREIEVPVSANELTRSVLSYFAKIGAKAWRNNTGAFKVEGTGNQRGRFVRYGQKGSADVFAILPPDGRFVAVEVKAGKDKLSEAQIDWLADAQKAGALTVVARSLDDVISAVENTKMGIAI